MAIPGTRDYGETNFITGMRAFAALAVVMIHAGGAGLRALGQVGNNIADLGRTGVYVLFVISGFSVASSFAASSGFAEYIHKRIWRIAPLYYFWIAAGVLLLKIPAGAYNLLIHASFLSFLDYKVTDRLLGVDWSLSVEMFWYFMVPPLMLLIRGRALALAAIPVCLLTYVAIHEAVDHLHVPLDSKWLALHFSPIPYILSYGLGVAAFRLRRTMPRISGLGDGVLLSVVSLLVLYVVEPAAVDRIFYDDFVFVSLLTFALVLFGSSRSRICGWVLTNRAALFLGTISYGIYLSHFPIVMFLSSLKVWLWPSETLRFLLLALGSILVSSLTYYLIERPALTFAQRLRRRVVVAEIDQSRASRQERA